jgi:excisionase family DNA binding protein
MSRSTIVTKAEIAAILADTPPILSPAKLATVLGLSPKTVYEWLAKGRLDGSFRRRGKHILIWRDRALDTIFNGANW